MKKNLFWKKIQKKLDLLANGLLEYETLTGNEISRVLAGKALNRDIDDFDEPEGYLKPGFHWRSSTDPDQLPWKPIPFYCISLCKEVVENWKENHVSVQQIAA